MSYQNNAAPPSLTANDKVNFVGSKKNGILFAVATVGTLMLLASFSSVRENPAPTNAMDRSFRKAGVVEMEGSSHHKHGEGAVATMNDLPMPSGVNFGSWLSLEDYFYAGNTGAVEVATPDANKAGVCLPPLHVGQQGAPTWQAETDLLASLTQSVGIAQALKVFHAHRTSFITERDLKKLAGWGIKHVRLPLSWCFTDANPDDIDPTKSKVHKDFNGNNMTSPEYTMYLEQQFTCADPFYRDENVKWPAIPRSMVVQLLSWSAKYGITVSLDLHTYPGATSPGTFSGVWPRAPRFWKHDNPGAPTPDIGRVLFRDFVAWMEQLAEDDPQAFAGLRGISPMNEPAHLAGAFRHTEKDYLPALPRYQADAYLQQLNGGDDVITAIPDGPHLRVLWWLQDAVETFGSSKLPSLGKQIHVNIHESFLSPEIVRDPKAIGNDGHPKDVNTIAAWWSRVTTPSDRESWAVLDMHHYHAWDSNCNGASDGPPAGNYTCSDATARTDTLTRCAKWAAGFRHAVDKHCGGGGSGKRSSSSKKHNKHEKHSHGPAQLMSGEFSTSTHHRVRHACNDLDTLEASYMFQMNAAKDAQVEMYYWSYKMPFGGAFKSAWSFSQLMYLLGVNDRPDTSTYNCGEHVPHAMEVNDDIFG